MKRLCMTLIGLVILYSCISNPLDSKQEDLGNNDSPLRTLLTKSAPIQQEDSLVIMSRLQKDVNYLMMNRIVFKDSVYVLAIKKHEALFLDVPEDVYDHYVEYVYSLNESL